MKRAGLLSVCRAWLGRPEAAPRAAAAFAEAVRDPERFARAARSQGLAAVALETAGRLAAPDPVRAALQAVARGDAARALALGAAAEELAGAARARGLSAVLLKGLALDRYYGGRGLRSAGDLDLLIAPRSIGQWEQCLAALGYEPMGPVDRTWRRTPIEVVDLHFKSSDAVGVIDVPEELSPVRLDLDGWRTRAVQPEGLPFPALSPEDELILAAGHGLGVHTFEMLVWLLDVAVLAAGPLDCDRLVSSARSAGADRLLHHALEAAAGLGLLAGREELRAALRPARCGGLERRLLRRLTERGLPGDAPYLLALALPAPPGYKRTLLGRALLPRRRAIESQALGQGPARGALRHAGRLLRLGTLAIWT